MKMLFTALVHPHLEFGNVVWVPHIQKDRLLIKGVQRHVTRSVPVLKELDYRKRPKSVDLPSMKYRRERAYVTETYIYISGLYSVNNSLLKIDIETVTRGHKYQLKKLRCCTSVHQNCFCLHSCGQLELIAV